MTDEMTDFRVDQSRPFAPVARGGFIFPSLPSKLHAPSPPDRIAELEATIAALRGELDATRGDLRNTRTQLDLARSDLTGTRAQLDIYKSLYASRINQNDDLNHDAGCWREFMKLLEKARK